MIKQKSINECWASTAKALGEDLTIANEKLAKVSKIIKSWNINKKKPVLALSAIEEALE